MKNIYLLIESGENWDKVINAYSNKKECEKMLNAKTLEAEQVNLCRNCIVNGKCPSECPHGVTCYGGIPSFPPCAEASMTNGEIDLYQYFEDEEIDIGKWIIERKKVT